MQDFPTRSQIDRAAPLTFDGVTTGDDPAFRDMNSAKRDAKRAAAARATDALNQDTLGKAPLEDIPAPPVAPAPVEKPKPAIVLSFTVVYRGRLITITGEHMSLDEFCDLLDRRLGVAQ